MFPATATQTNSHSPGPRIKICFYPYFFLLQPPTDPSFTLCLSQSSRRPPLFFPLTLRDAGPCLFRAHLRTLSSLYSYFISVPSFALASPAIPPCSPVVGCADFFLDYRPVDRAAIRWTAIRIDYSLPKLRRGAFILYNSPAALVPSLLFPRFFPARYNRARRRRRRLVRDVNRAARSCERKTTRRVASAVTRAPLKIGL